MSISKLKFTDAAKFNERTTTLHQIVSDKNKRVRDDLTVHKKSSNVAKVFSFVLKLIGIDYYKHYRTRTVSDKFYVFAKNNVQHLNADNAKQLTETLDVLKQRSSKKTAARIEKTQDAINGLLYNNLPQTSASSSTNNSGAPTLPLAPKLPPELPPRKNKDAAQGSNPGHLEAIRKGMTLKKTEETEKNTASEPIIATIGGQTAIRDPELLKDQRSKLKQVKSEPKLATGPTESQKVKQELDAAREKREAEEAKRLAEEQQTQTPQPQDGEPDLTSGQDAEPNSSDTSASSSGDSSSSEPTLGDQNAGSSNSETSPLTPPSDTTSSQDNGVLPPWSLVPPRPKASTMPPQISVTAPTPTPTPTPRPVAPPSSSVGNAVLEKMNGHLGEKEKSYSDRGPTASGEWVLPDPEEVKEAVKKELEREKAEQEARKKAEHEARMAQLEKDKIVQIPSSALSNPSEVLRTSSHSTVTGLPTSTLSPQALLTARLGGVFTASAGASWNLADLTEEQRAELESIRFAFDRGDSLVLDPEEIKKYQAQLDAQQK